MKLKATFEEMEIVLNELNEQFETIKENEIRVPQIEIDIIMATVRRFYESFSHLNKQKQYSEVEKQKVITPEKVDVLIEKEVKQSTKEPFIDIKVEEEPFLMEEESVYEKISSDFLKEIENAEENATEEIAEIKMEFIAVDAEPAKVEKSSSSLLLQFEDEIFSVNESVAQKSEDKSIVNKLGNSRIENLKSAIGINDKFFFINELFSGNSQAYEDVIYTLNNFKRFEEAMQYISTLKYRYDWKTESEAYQKLLRFLERKFVQIHA